MKNFGKRRYSVPSRMLELLYSDDSYFSEVSKIKKSGLSSGFPKSDEWVDSEGFHISFALAGYSPDDITISVFENILEVTGGGLDSIPVLEKKDVIKTSDASDDSEPHEKNRFHMGAISRGIARRKFQVSSLISHEFDLMMAKANMEHGLLHIVVPNRLEFRQSEIKIENKR